MAIVVLWRFNQHQKGVEFRSRLISLGILAYIGYKLYYTRFYYPTLLSRLQITRERSTNIRYLYSSHSSRPREFENLGKSEFWEKKLLDNKSLIRRFGV